MKTYTVFCALPQGIVMTVLGSDFMPVTRRIANGENPGVDAAFWEKWIAQNASYGPVKAGMIMGVEDVDAPAEPVIVPEQADAEWSAPAPAPVAEAPAPDPDAPEPAPVAEAAPAPEGETV